MITREVMKIILMLFLSITKASYDAGVPVIDFQKLDSADETVWEPEQQKFLNALEQVGFFVLTNHGIPKEVMDGTWDVERRFFDTATENKMTVQMTDDYIYGYTAAEILARSETADGYGSLPDDKESLNIMIGSANGSHVGEAKFPPEPFDMEEIVTSYYRHLEDVVASLLKITARALELPLDFFEDKIDDHLSVVRMLNYPHQEKPPAPGVLRCSPHTDYGTFTILRQDAVGGLQVEKEQFSNEWVDVVTEFYDFSVNIGDLMRRWTNKRFRSTRHRVVNYPNPSAEGSNRRQTLVFFHNLNADALVETIPSCYVDGKSFYRPVTFHDYLASKHHATQLYNEDGKSEL